MSNTRGRQPIGINQPPSGGSSYPFVKPSDDIQYLLGDFFLSFDDLRNEFTFPFRISWLYGFGTNSVSPITGYPSPTHSHDLLVVDANNKLVFNSTAASIFYSDVWDNRLLILEWQTGDKVVRCTQHTAWTAADIADGLNKTYDLYIAPENGELQQDTCYRLPKRVTSLQVGLVNIAKTRVALKEGYNTGIKIGSDILAPEIDLPNFLGVSTQVPGERLSNSIEISAVAGSGLGVFPGCTQEELLIRTFNGLRSNAYQNFIWDGEGCIRYQRPVGLANPDPRLFSYAAFTLSGTEAASAIEVLNDCQNCCDCTYFAQTYQGVKRQWFLYRDVATAAATTRDILQANIDRWETQKAIREANVLRTSLRQDGSAKITWGIALCNASHCCLQGISFRLTWLVYVNGILTTPVKPVYSCQGTELESSAECDKPVNITLAISDVTGLVSTAFADFADPQSVTTVSGRHCFPDANDVDFGDFRIKLHVAASVENKLSPSDKPCPTLNIDPSEYDTDVLSVWTALGLSIPDNVIAQKLSSISDVDSRSAYCRSCDCN